jgi:hypothetical protein
MRRIDLLRARKSHPGGWSVGDPFVHDKYSKNDDIMFFRWPSVDKIWFVCDANGKPFPRSGCDNKSGAITMFLVSLDLPSHEHDPETGEGYCHCADEPERGRWWQWFKNRGFSLQKFEVNPADADKPKSVLEFLRYELRWANQARKGCVWCTSAKRFQNISARLKLMFDAIDYYSERPDEQRRWLQTMHELYDKRGKGSRL